MGNFFDKKQDWRNELQTIKTELAALENRRQRWVIYERRTRFLTCCCLIASLVTAFVLLLFSNFYASLPLLIFCVILYPCKKFCISCIFNAFTKQNEEKIAKHHVAKTRLVKEIKENVTYNEAKSLLSGYDSEVDRTNDTVLDLEPLVY